MGRQHDDQHPGLPLPLLCTREDHALPLNSEFGQAWSSLPTYGDAKNGKLRRPPYAGLASALSAVSGQPVVLMPHTYEPVNDDFAEPAVAVTTKPFDAWTLSTAVREWERRVRKGEDANTLAPLLAAAEVEHPELASFVRGAEDGTPHAPGWFYRVAAWNFAQRLARTPCSSLTAPACAASIGAWIPRAASSAGTTSLSGPR